MDDIAPRESESTSTLLQLPPTPAHTPDPSSTTFEWQNESCQAREVFALLERATACRMFEYKLQWLHRISLNLFHKCTIIPALGGFSQGNRILLTCIRTQRHRRSFQAHCSAHFHYRSPPSFQASFTGSLTPPAEVTPFLEPQAHRSEIHGQLEVCLHCTRAFCLPALLKEV